MIRRDMAGATSEWGGLGEDLVEFEPLDGDDLVASDGRAGDVDGLEYEAGGLALQRVV